MEIKQYAPILIPTLNRYDHFKRCLESLEQCAGADKTDVYVALDYPPSEKYVDGWKKLSEYLKIKEKNNKFNKLIIEYREHNCGVCNPTSNTSLLIKQVSEKYSRYIFTEDDNEFSPCFLDFMNKALEKYNDDPRVFTVCGYNRVEYQVPDKSIIFTVDNSAWGLGRWVHKELPSKDYVIKQLHSIKSVIRMWSTYPALMIEILSMLKKGTIYGDASWCLKCICEGMYQVRPSLSLTRNTGDDGSGQHTGTSGKFSTQDISDEALFDIPDVEVERTKEIDKAVYNNMLPTSAYLRMKTHAKILVELVSFYFSASK